MHFYIKMKDKLSKIPGLYETQSIYKGVHH